MATMVASNDYSGEKVFRIRLEKHSNRFSLELDVDESANEGISIELSADECHRLAELLNKVPGKKLTDGTNIDRELEG